MDDKKKSKAKDIKKLTWQHEITRKAERMKPSCCSGATSIRYDGECIVCGLTANGMTKDEEKALAKEIKKAKKGATSEVLFVDPKDAKKIREILKHPFVKDSVLYSTLEKIFGDDHTDLRY